MDENAGAAAMGAMQAVMEGVKDALMLGVGYAFFALIVITVDRLRANSASKEDGQVELKILLYGLVLISVVIAAFGANTLLAYVLGGFKGGSGPIKLAIPPLLIGGGGAFALIAMFLPRTNASTTKAGELLALLALGLYFGAKALMEGDLFLTGLFTSMPWGVVTAPAMAGLLVHGAIGVLALMRLGQQSAWTMPVRPAAPMSPPGYPPQGGGYPPQGGGYPQQGGGYPPQQGGGYPPQGGGYPPQGGGYPPR